MSVQAITWALDYPARSVTEKVILLVLANYANEYGISWPSQRTLAEQSACTDRTVRTILHRFEAWGVVRRIARRRGNGSRQSDMILLAGFEGRKPAPPGMLEGGDDGPGEQAEEPSACAPNRKAFPGAKRKGLPHPPDPASALDTSKTRKDSAMRNTADAHLACLAMAGPGLDRSESGPLALSRPEIDRWLAAGCDLLADILPVITARTAAPRPEPIRSWAYFTAAVLAAKARRETPLPHQTEDADEDGTPRRKAKLRESAARDLGDAWDAAVAKANRARAAQADPDA